MATPLLLPLSSFLLLLLLSLSTATTTTTATATTTIQQACKATLYPNLCHSSLSSTTATPPHIISSAVSLSSHHLTTALSLTHSLLSSSSSSHNHNLSSASSTCLHLLSLSSSALLLHHPSLKDARASTSAALTYQYDCWSELSYTNSTRLVAQTMSFLNSTLMPATSNALSLMMAYDNAGPDVDKWGPPRTERDGFWERVGFGSGSTIRALGFEVSGGPTTFKMVNATVCKEKAARGCHKTVQGAVDGAPSGLKGRDRFVIYIKEGVYNEIVRVPLEKSNLVFLGDGMGKTVITGSVNTGILGISTYNTATVGVEGDGFMASGITFQNTAGPNAHQAVAFRSDSDFSLVENCEFLSNQDTLYVHSLRQVYRSCRIEGNVDFIFGNAAALFEDCTILVRPRLLDPEKGENNAVTAHGRTDPAQTTGLVFLGCLVNGTEEYMRLWRANPKVHRNFLGRPWKMYSRTVFIGCTLERLISPEGWMPFREDFALSTLYYGEFGNKGPGADMSKRVKWSSQIPKVHLSAYSAKTFIQADEWKSAF